jgi:DNA-binding response OmpR family regulator
MPRTASPILLIEGSLMTEALIRHAMSKAKSTRPLVVHRAVAGALAYLAMAMTCVGSVTHPLPGLVILSLRFRRDHGVEFVNWMRSESKLAKTPLVILTPSGEHAAWKRMYHSKVDLVLLKPVTREQLMKAMEQHYRPQP